MSAAIELVCDLAQKGVVVEAADGRIAVRPATSLTADDRAALYLNREEILDALMDGPDTWKVMDKAYMRHHTGCRRCQAAGRGKQYGQPCDVGRLLWRNYEEAFERTPPTGQIPNDKARAQPVKTGVASSSPTTSKEQ